MKNFTEKHFKKIIAGGTGLIVALLCVLMLVVNTNVVSAVSSEWKDNIILKANVDIATTGQETVDELLAKEVNAGVDQSDLDSYIKQQEALLDKLIREYYDAKLSGLTSDDDLAILKAQIDNIRANLLIEYKGQIDKAFVNYQ